MVNEGVDTDALVAVRTDVADRVTLSEAGHARERAAAPTATATPSRPPSESGSPSGSPSVAVGVRVGHVVAERVRLAVADRRRRRRPRTPETSIPIPAAGLIELRDDGPGDRC